MKKVITVDIICYAIILLFVYAALSKLFMYNIYVYDVHRSPYIGQYSSLLSVALPTLELGISAMLLFERIRLYALYAASILMALFTIYVGLIIFTVDNQDKPCTCGGLIRDLSWPQHFALNIFYMFIAVLATMIHRNIIKNNIKKFAQ